MTLTLPPISYPAIRAAISQAMQAATGLGTNAVIMLQPEQPVAARPPTPFATFMLTTTAQSMGRDVMEYLPGSRDVWRYSGPRMLACQFQFFGQTHDEAHGMAAVWLASLDQDPTQDILAQGGLSVWRREQAQDISQLLYTGFECRAAMSCTFGVLSAMQVNVGSIEHVPVSGTVDAGGHSHLVETTVDREDA